MNVREVVLQSIALVLLSFGAALIELMYLDAPLEIVFLREDALYPNIPPKGLSESKSISPALAALTAARYPTPKKYCTDNKCDIADLTYVLYISETTAHALFEAGESQFIDARQKTDYVNGHVPYALNIPVAAFASGWPDVMKKLMKELEAVVYCEGMSCDASQLVAKHLIRYGFKKVKIIETGFPGWMNAGYPVEAGQADG